MYQDLIDNPECVAMVLALLTAANERADNRELERLDELMPMSTSASVARVSWNWRKPAAMRSAKSWWGTPGCPLTTSGASIASSMQSMTRCAPTA